MHQTHDVARRANAYSEAPGPERSTRLSTPPSTPSTPQSLNSFIFTDEDLSRWADVDSTALEVYRVSNGGVDVWNVRTVKAGHWKVKESSSAGTKNANGNHGKTGGLCIGTPPDERTSTLLQSLETAEEGRCNRFCRGQRVAMGKAKEVFPAARGTDKISFSPGSTRPAEGETLQGTRDQSRWARLRDLWCFA